MASEPTKQRFVQEQQDLTVEGADVEGLSVEVSEGSHVSGVVTIEGNSASPQFIGVVAGRYKGGANSYVRLDEAGKFALTAYSLS